MASIHLIHPDQHLRSDAVDALRADGWSVSEAHGRSDAIARLASPLGQRFGDLVLIDLQNWVVPGTALVRAIRRQATAPLPVLVRLPLHEDLLGLAAESARRAGANVLVTADHGPEALARLAALMTGRSGPPPTRGQAPGLADLWQQQCELLALPDHAAATVLSARRVFEGLLALRTDERAAEAAMTLAGLTGGPLPLARWAGWFHPSHASVASAATLDARRQAGVTLCLLFDAGGQRYALPMDAPVAPSAWWTDGHPLPEQVEAPAGAWPLVRLLGSSGFRRLLITDRATIVLHDRRDPAAPEPALRVDEVLRQESLAIDACPPHLAQASGCLGSARDSEGEPVLVLEGSALLRTLTRIATTDLARFG